METTENGSYCARTCRKTSFVPILILLFLSLIVTFVLPSVGWVTIVIGSPPSSSASSQTEEKTITATKIRGNKRPAVVWLMTFPNSGTSYTMEMIEQYTNTTVASNYGYDHVEIPVHIGGKETGPFLNSPELRLPSEYILTKTHCGGYDFARVPRAYIETLRSFEVACRSGTRSIYTKQDDDTNSTDMIRTKGHVIYPDDIPEKAVHLIRNPMDNLIARMHMERRKWLKKRRDSDEYKIEHFTTDKEGFQEWCNYTNAQGLPFELEEPHFLDEELLDLMQGVPCYADFYRYIQWHNLAIQTSHRLHLPVHYMWYENYTLQFQRTVDELLDFLHLTPAPGATPVPFNSTGKEYVQEYFHDYDIQRIRQLFEKLATPESWSRMRHYF